MSAETDLPPEDFGGIILREIVELLPARLTIDEMVLWVAKQGDHGAIAAKDAIAELRRSGLIRLSGDVLEPTLAAFRATEILA